MGDRNDEGPKPHFAVRAWLIMYNIALTAGWLAVGVGMGMYAWKHRTHKGLYGHVRKQLLFFQSIAVLEIIHAAVGIVRSNALFTTIQVASRVVVVWLIAEPVYQVQDSKTVAMFLTAWTITEVIRYCYYSFQLLGSPPYLIVWMRYTLFIILYPFGVMGEVLTIYQALPYIAESGMFSVSMPNEANFSFNFYYAVISIFPVYVVGFPRLYIHMFAQRRKIIGSSTSTSKKIN